MRKQDRQYITKLRGKRLSRVLIAPLKTAMEMCVTPIRVKVRLNIHLFFLRWHHAKKVWKLKQQRC